MEAGKHQGSANKQHSLSATRPWINKKEKMNSSHMVGYQSAAAHIVYQHHKQRIPKLSPRPGNVVTLPLS